MLLLRVLLLSFFLSSTVYAADNPRLMGYPPNQLMGFRGLDTRSKAPNVQDSRATDLRNVKLSKSLDLNQRDGYSIINGTLDDLVLSSPAITSIFDAHFSDGTNFAIVTLANILKYNNAGTWTTIPSFFITEAANNQFVWITALDRAIATNDTDVPFQVDTNKRAVPLDVSDLSDALTKAKTTIWFRNYLIFGNTVEASTERPTRFRWSDVGTIEDWTDDNFVDIAALGGDEIIAFAELYGDVYIFLKNSIWKASLVGGDDVFVFTKVIEGFGAISKSSVTTVSLENNQQAIIFLDQRKKVFMFNGTALTDIGAIIQPTLDGLNESRLEFSTSIFDGKNWYLSVSNGGITTNDLVFVFQTEIFEWTRYSQIDANAWGRVQETTSKFKTYFGNYSGFVYWLDNPDNIDDVKGVTGIVESAGTLNQTTETQIQVIVDQTPGFTNIALTGAIVRITQGQAVGEERVILENDATSFTVVSAFSTTPTTTSNYTVGDIDSFYTTKYYDLGDAPRLKVFRKLFFWAREDTSNEVNVSYAEDFGTDIDSESISLSPTSGSLWDSAVWDESVWGTTGDKFYTSDLAGEGRYIRIKYSQTDVGKDFNIYGFHLLADRLDVE